MSIKSTCFPPSHCHLDMINRYQITVWLFRINNRLQDLRPSLDLWCAHAFDCHSRSGLRVVLGSRFNLICSLSNPHGLLQLFALSSVSFWSEFSCHNRRQSKNSQVWRTARLDKRWSRFGFSRLMSALSEQQAISKYFMIYDGGGSAKSMLHSGLLLSITSHLTFLYSVYFFSKHRHPHKHERRPDEIG